MKASLKTACVPMIHGAMIYAVGGFAILSA